MATAAAQAEKKKLSAKEKKAQRRETAQRAQEDQAFLQQALTMGDIFEGYDVFRRYDRNGVQAALSYHKAEDMPKGLREFCFGLVKHTMQELYEACPDIGGWSDKVKWGEMFEEELRSSRAGVSPP